MEETTSTTEHETLQNSNIEFNEMQSITNHEASWLLRLNANRIQIISSIIGIVLGIILSFAFIFFSKNNLLTERLFDLESGKGILPLVMLCMFFWGITLCLIRKLRIQKIENLLNVEKVSKLTQIISTTTLPNILDQLNEIDDTHKNPLHRRLRILIRQWDTKPSLQDSISLLNQQSLSDSEDIQHSYGVLKTFVWALPVLGLIGTVIGITFAVGDFSNLIGGNVDDVNLIKKSLVEVTTGLSFAFTTTLLGLLGALLLVLPTSAIQTQEEKLVTKMEGIVTDHFLPQLQRLYPESTSSGLGIDINPLVKLLAENASIMRKLHESSITLLERQNVLLKSMQVLNDGDMVKTLGALTGNMENIGRYTAESIRVLTTMTETKKLLADTHENLIKNLQTIEDMDLKGSLDNLGNTLIKVTEVLQHFQEPVVFQAIKASDMMKK